MLSADRLSVGYDGVPVVRELDLEVRAGEVVVLLGANGAGKTTTLLGLGGVLPPLAGTVRWLGRERRVPLHGRCRAGMAFVPETRSVIPGLNVRDNLRLGRGGVEAALEAVPELRPLLKRRAGLLSGGEQQMLTLARALAGKPRLLLADELSLGLAPLIVQRLLRMVREAADAGLGVLLVEQQARNALAVADRAYVLRRGRVVLQGRADDLLGRISEVEAGYLAGAQS
ncbi:ABC transporter ATP-binding protein [Streptomyces sp. MNU77]|nr:ABC transporter ATP-binding protein [Streptomyces sp. MNU77]